MPIWGELELLCMAVAQEGQREAQAILAKAQAEADRIIADGKERAEKDYQTEIHSQRSNAHAVAKRMMDSADLEARRAIMAFREQVIREVFDALEERLKEFRREPSYADFVVKALREGIENLPGKEFIVEANQEDLDLVGETMKALPEQLNVTVEIKPAAALDGGVRVYTGDRRLLYDNSLSARLKRVENDLRQDIWRKVFGAQGK